MFAVEEVAVESVLELKTRLPRIELTFLRLTHRDSRESACRLNNKKRDSCPIV